MLSDASFGGDSDTRGFEPPLLETPLCVVEATGGVYGADDDPETVTDADAETPTVTPCWYGQTSSAQSHPSSAEDRWGASGVDRLLFALGDAFCGSQQLQGALGSDPGTPDSRDKNGAANGASSERERERRVR